MVENSGDSLTFSSMEDNFVDADPFKIGRISLGCKKFEEDPPPQLMELAGDNEGLQLIAENLKILMDQQGFVKYSKENRADIELGIRTFVYQAANLAKQSIAPIANVQPAGTPVNPKTATNEEQKEFTKENYEKLKARCLQLEKENQRLDYNIKAAERIRDDLKTENTNLQNENEALFDKNSELIKLLNESRRENANQGLKMKELEMKFSEDGTNLTDQLELSKFTIQRLEKQLENTNEDLSAATAQVSILKSKLAAKNAKITDFKKQAQNQAIQYHQIEAENDQLNIQLNNLMTKLEEMSHEIDDLNPQRHAELEEERNRLLRGVKKLTLLCEQQANEISVIQDAYNRSGAVLQRQNQLIAAYDSKMGAAYMERDQAVAEQTQLREEATRAEISLSQVAQPTAEEQSKIETFEDVRSQLTSKFGDLDEDGVKGAVSELLSTEGLLEMKAQNKRLLGLIENQLRFLSKLTTSGEMELFLISTPNADDTLLEDQAYRDLVLVEIARCRQFLADNGFADAAPSVHSGRSFLEAHKELTLPVREGFDAAAFALQAAEIIRAFSAKLVETNQRLMEGLEPIRELLQLDCAIEDVPGESLQTLRKVRAFFKAAKDATEEDFDYLSFDSSVDFLGQFVRESASIRRSIEDDLRPLINFDGATPEVPASAAQFIRDMMAEIEGMEIASANELRKQLSALREELDGEKEQSTRVIGELEIELERKDEENKDLSERLKKNEAQLKDTAAQLAFVTSKRDDLAMKYDQINMHYEDVSRDLASAREENNGMREELKQRASAYDARAMKLLNEERQQHADDMDALETKFRVREEKMREDLEAKSAKLAEAKKTLKKLIEDYDTAFRKQKEATAALRAQNQQLAGRLAERSVVSRSPRKQTTELEQLKSEIRSLEAEKSMLSVKLSQVSERAEKAAAARDNYWESQMAVRDTEVSKSQLEMEEAAKEELMDYVGKVGGALEAYAPRQFGGGEEETLELVRSVVARLAEAERTAAALAAARKPPVPERKTEEEKTAEMAKAVQAIATVGEWEKWARSTFANASREAAPEEPRELRRRIADMAISSLSQRRLLERLESLRAQKAALLAGAADATPDAALHAAPLFQAVLAVARLARGCDGGGSVIGSRSPTKSGLSILK